MNLQVGTPVVPFCPPNFGVSLVIKLNGRKKGTLTFKGLLGNLGKLRELWVTGRVEGFRV